MDRLALIQRLIKKKAFISYLEIGVLGGAVFFNVKCRKKIAVDPQFRFNWKGKLGGILRNKFNINNRYFEVTSDVFFNEHAARIFENRPLDICLVDGMHEFRYALNDVLNTLIYLSGSGVIIMHDCNPLSPEAACSFEEWKARNFAGYWNGDTWKIITYLLHNRPDLDVFTVDCDHGLGVIKKKVSAENYIIDEIQFAAINSLRYPHLDDNRKTLLNLKSVDYLQEYFQL